MASALTEIDRQQNSATTASTHAVLRQAASASASDSVASITRGKLVSRCADLIRIARSNEPTSRMMPALPPFNARIPPFGRD